MRQPLGVVVGVRDLRRGLRALDWAARQAVAGGRVLTVCHVLPPEPVDPPIPAAARLALADQRRLLVDLAARRAKQAHLHLAVEQRVDRGPVVPALLEYAAAADEVILGAGTGWRARRPGSIVAELAAQAPCPVTAVRGPIPRRPEVVVGVDSPDHDRGALDYGFGYAADHELPVRIVHAYRDAAAAGDRRRPNGRQRAHLEAIELVDQAVQPWAEKYPGIPVATTIAGGHPADVLVDASNGATLLVVGSRGLSGLSGLLLGSVSRALLARATCPVTVTH